MKVALVVIGRLENRYAEEFVEYYKQLGFDQIFIIDNNYDGEEHFEDVLQSYIDDNFVTIVDYRNVKNKPGDGWNTSIQVISYLDVYNKIKNDYDWIAYLDFDEYLVIPVDGFIKKYLSRKCFETQNQILINWKIYTDSDLIYDDGRPCLERFIKPMPIYKCVEYDYSENKHVKAIIRGGLNNLIMYTPHNFYSEELSTTTCDNAGINGYIRKLSGVKEINYRYAYVKHFCTKTIDEYITNKQKRGTADRNINDFGTTYPLLRFFKYNKVTPEKLNYLKEKGFDISDINEKNIDKWYVEIDQTYLHNVNDEVILVCVGKFTNVDLIDFIEHYRSIGFRKIFFVNIDSKADEWYDETLSKYLDMEFIEIVNYNCRSEYLINSYDDIYERISNMYDWVIFLDLNQYLILNEYDHINKYLCDKYKKYNTVMFIESQNTKESYDKMYKNMFVKAILLNKSEKTFVINKNTNYIENSGKVKLITK